MDCIGEFSRFSSNFIHFYRIIYIIGVFGITFLYFETVSVHMSEILLYKSKYIKSFKEKRVSVGGIGEF